MAGGVPRRRPRGGGRAWPTTSRSCPRGRSGSRCPTTCASACSPCRCPDPRDALDELVETVLRDVLPHAMGNGHPAFFGWVNPPPSPAGVLASLTAAAMNPSVVGGDHADVHLERAVVRWLAELVGFPHAPGAGLLTSGASAATVVCLAGARSKALAGVGHDVRRDGLAGAPPLAAYVPAEAHSCVQRGLELLGFGSAAMREVPLDGGRLDADALRAAIAADRAAVRCRRCWSARPAPSTPGAIDPLDALADVAAAEASGSTWTAPTAPLACSTRRSRRATAAWSGPTRWCSTRTSGSGYRSMRAARSCGRRRPARRVQPDPALPAPAGPGPGRHVRRVRVRADAAVPRAEDLGDGRRAGARRDRRPRRSLQRARPRAGGMVEANPSSSWRSRRRRPSSRFAPARRAARPSAWRT